ncbi:MAG: DUF2147 domain-containing protein [Gammaproteobacteria bacterium]
MRNLIRCLCCLLMLAAMQAFADGPDAVLGTWVTADGKARVEVVKAGEVYSGSIVWLKEPLYPADDASLPGKPKVDRNNPDKAQQDRPIIGLPLIQGFKYANDNVWSDGTIYDPDSGKLYSCKLTLMMDGSLRVRGYVGISLFGRTEIWTRPPSGSTATQP